MVSPRFEGWSDPGPAIDLYTLKDNSPDVLDPSSWTTGVTRELVDGARDAALLPAQAATRDAANAATAVSTPEALDLTVTVSVSGVDGELSVDPDRLLGGLTTVYAVGGWSAVNDAISAVDKRVAQIDDLLQQAQAGVDIYGTPASSLDPAKSGDRSGYTDSYDLIGSPGALQSADPEALAAQREAWLAAQKNVALAREMIALGIVRTLTHVEQLAGGAAILAMNTARDGAGSQLRRYYADPTASKEIAEKVKKERESLKSIVDSLVRAHSDVQNADATYETALADRERIQQGLSSPGTESVDPNRARVQAAAAQTSFQDLLTQGRKDHPVSIPAMLMLKPGFTDEDLFEAVSQFLDTIIATAEAFAPPPTGLANAVGDPSAWQEVLREGPEAWLLDRADLDAFVPISFEPLIAPLLDSADLEPFEFVALAHYLDGLSQRAEDREARAAAGGAVGTLALVSMALSASSILAPELAIIAGAIDASLAVNAAVEAVSAAASLKSQFTADMLATLAQSTAGGTVQEWNRLGEVLARRPLAIDYARLLINAGVAVVTATSVVTHIRTERLYMLQLLGLLLGQA